MHRNVVSTGILVCSLIAGLAFAGTAAAQQPAPGQTAEQAYKNIQVLKGIPADQITPTMRVIARDLGVNCEFCHDEKDRSLDTEDTKDTARSMIRMVQEINKNSFGGQTAVTCVTCHNGHSDPTNVPTLPPFSVAYLGPGDEVKPPQLPSIDQILSKYVQALGGEQALRKVTSIVMTGSRQNYGPAGQALAATFPVERYWKAPNMSAEILRPGRGGVTSSGFDGTAAWSQDGRGRVTQLAGAAANRAKRDADFYWPLDMKDQYRRLTVQSIEKLGNREAYVVVAAPQNEKAESFYFDTQTGLLLRHQVLLPTAIGDSPFATEYEDYRDAGNGVKMPFTMNIVGPSRPDCALIKFDKIQLNAAIDNSKLAKPQPSAQ